MSEDKLHLFEICRNAEGHLLAYLSPLDEEGREKSGYRIAGPKAWGGSKSLAKIKISTSDLAVYVNQYAPDVRRMVDSDSPALLDALEKAVAHIERNTCQHEDTYRGGAIWEICRECGAKWADDKGGKPEFKWPDSVLQASALIAKHRGGA